MRFVIVTGVSGAGKSTALKMLEDAYSAGGEICVIDAGGTGRRSSECGTWH